MSGIEITLGTALSAVGTGLSVVSSLAQGQAARRAADYNAALYERNAQVAQQRAAVDEARQRRLAAMRAGANRAAIGASGVAVEGSPLDILESNAAQEELDALMIRWNAANAASDARASGELARATGRSAQTQSFLQAGSALLLGGAKVYDRMPGPPPLRGGTAP
jgi:hypothetical protein